MLIFQGIRPYGCNICLKSYSQQSNLKKHILTHQKKSGKNGKNVPIIPPTSTANFVIYQCNICKQELGDISDFNKHIKVCNLNPMNNPHIQHQLNVINGPSTISSSSMIEPKKESIEIKTETLDEGSNNTHTPPGMPHIHQVMVNIKISFVNLMPCFNSFYSFIRNSTCNTLNQIISNHKQYLQLIIRS